MRLFGWERAKEVVCASVRGGQKECTQIFSVYSIVLYRIILRFCRVSLSNHTATHPLRSYFVWYLICWFIQNANRSRATEEEEEERLL